MPCYKPLSAMYCPNAPEEYPKVVFSNPPYIGVGYQYEHIQVPCGQCIGCRLERSRQWAVRCVHEASLYKENCFITLTFNNDNLNPSRSLVKCDFQNFMKRLRFKYGYGIRFFHCGEYGSKLGRPHHHACLFNFNFPDLKLWQVRQGIYLYRSEQLEKLWSITINPSESKNYHPDLVWVDDRGKTHVKLGFCTVGEVTFESAAYCARYIMKKITGKDSRHHYGDRIPEYITMSRNPGIARAWFEKYKSDVFPNDYIILRDGIKCRPPKYYNSIYELTEPDKYALIKDKRKSKLILPRDDYERWKEERRRLPDREECLKLRMKKLIRSYEDLC